MKKILVSIVGVLFVVFIFAVIWRAFVLVGQQKTAQIVEGIQNTRLTMDDVLGTNLPPNPGEEADKTIAGVDANANGIRDDVELAIFRDYPNDPKTRAVLLQYALALQNFFVINQVNTDTSIALIQQESRGYFCVGTRLDRNDLSIFIEESDQLRKFVENLQLNTADRLERRSYIYSKVDSHNSLENECDIVIP
jgi:hypothetical protein